MGDMKSLGHESERNCDKVCQEGRLWSLFPQQSADVLCLVSVAASCGPSFLRLCNCQPTTKVLQPANCAVGSTWISKQGFLETGQAGWVPWAVPAQLRAWWCRELKGMQVLCHLAHPFARKIGLRKLIWTIHLHLLGHEGSCGIS